MPSCCCATTRSPGSPVLPLDGPALRRLAVVGPLADVVNTGDAASSDVRAPAVVTPFAGLRAALDAEVVHDDGSDPARAARLAADADAAIVVVGYTSADEGEYLNPSANPELFALFPPLDPADPAAAELAGVLDTRLTRPPGGDRERLTLHDRDEELLRTVAAAQPRTVAVLVTGSAVVTERWRHAVPAIVVAWYSGMEGGHALADVLLGRVTPSGRLPCAFPVDDADLPPFDRHARHVEYGRYHGSSTSTLSGGALAFPLGWGLSYTEFRYGPLAVTVGPDHLGVDLEVTNEGRRGGTEVVQCYAEAPESSVERPARSARRLPAGHARRRGDGPGPAPGPARAARHLGRRTRRPGGRTHPLPAARRAHAAADGVAGTVDLSEAGTARSELASG